MLHKASIAGLAMDPDSNTPIVLLKTDDGDTVVPIWIGLLEATAIASAMKNIAFDRPMTHDLFKNFAGLFQINISKIEVCDIRDNTYYALIHFHAETGAFTMDARPSDAIALALRFDAPIFIDQQVIDKSARKTSDGEPLDESEEGRKWADYLKNLSPEEFGKYKV
ncbi:MAG: bifunctional nuclease domain-containing protein [Pseudomonadota bacterium]